MDLESQTVSELPTPRFQKINELITEMAVDETTVKSQILDVLKLKLPEIEDHPLWGKSKGNEPVAIVGGGPSIKYTVDTLRNFKTIICAGSAHDWLVEHGIVPTYTVIVDPEIVVLNYLKRAHPNCTYLICSCCHPKVFEAMQDYAVVRWHTAGIDEEWYSKAWNEAGITKNEKKPIIGGGCTCGLRSISMAHLFGYRNLHLFGLDSNLDLNTNEHHAYAFVDPEHEFLGDVVEMCVGDEKTGRRFMVAKYMMAQLWGLRDLIGMYYHAFDITVHGDSLAYEFMKMKKHLMASKAKELSSGHTD